MKLTTTLTALAFTACVFSASASAATLRVSSAFGNLAPQPGDVVAVAVVPAAGETIVSIGMAAFDTPSVKFYAQPDGSARAYVGFPFDRSGGNVTLRAQVRIEKDGSENVTTQNLTTTFRAASRNYPTQRISMGSSMAGTMSKTAALRAEKLYVQSKMKDSNPTPFFRGSWVVPTPGRSTSSYGRRRYVNGKWWGQHNGADVKASTGTPVKAANSGRVVLSEHLRTLRGNCIVLDHGNNVYSLYLHLSQRAVKVGDMVTRGQQIGKVGATGFVTGPHLHWEMRVGWEPVDPAKVVRYGLRF